jgi:hypothetical protein
MARGCILAEHITPAALASINRLRVGQLFRFFSQVRQLVMDGRDSGWRLKPRLWATLRSAAKAACAASSQRRYILKPAKAGFAIMREHGP